jgi:hypothetical protein
MRKMTMMTANKKYCNTIGHRRKRNSIYIGCNDGQFRGRDFILYLAD